MKGGIRVQPRSSHLLSIGIRVKISGRGIFSSSWIEKGIVAKHLLQLLWIKDSLERPAYHDADRAALKELLKTFA